MKSDGWTTWRWLEQGSWSSHQVPKRAARTLVEPQNCPPRYSQVFTKMFMDGRREKARLENEIKTKLKLILYLLFIIPITMGNW